jgi:hypothetical protein
MHPTIWQRIGGNKLGINNCTYLPINKKLRPGNLQEKMKGLEKRPRTLENKKEADNLMLARIREYLEAIFNKNKEDRIVITGPTNTILMPSETENK